jgi:hypothetical protein
LRSIATLCVSFTLACPGTQVDVDASIDATSELPPLVEAGVDACGPLDASGFQPAAMMPASAPHAGACSAQQASDFAKCLGGGDAALCQQFQQGMPGQACGECVETPATAAHWGVVVTSGSSNVFNVEGCIDAALGELALEKGSGGSGSCGDLLYAFYGCEAAACAACVGSSRDMCVGQAGSACSTYDAPVESSSGPCAPLLSADASVAPSCTPNAAITDPQAQVVDWIQRMVTFMCGS